MKVCLDTNVLISAFLSHGLCEAIFKEVSAKERFHLLLPPAIILELERILRDKFALHADLIAVDVAIAANFARDPGEIPPLPDIRDRADAAILAAAAALGVECFVTGDQELLELGKHEAMRVVSPRQFWELARLATD